MSNYYVNKHDLSWNQTKPHKYHSLSLYLIQSEKGSYDGIAAASFTLTSHSTSCSLLLIWWRRKNKLLFYTLDKYSYALVFFKLARTLFIRMWFRLWLWVQWAFIASQQRLIIKSVFWSEFLKFLTWQAFNTATAIFMSRQVWWLFCQQIHKQPLSIMLPRQ